MTDTTAQGEVGGRTAGSALRRCISVPPDDFASRVWSREPLLSTHDNLGGATGFADLFSLGAVDELLSRRGLRTPFLRMAKGGNVVPPARYTRPGGTGALIGDQIADDRVLDLFITGHTIVLQALHRTWGPIIDFAGALTTELGHPVQVNAYITPEQSQGFSAHYDVHDVFVLQIAGEKRWRIHAPVLPDPLRDEPWTDRRADVASQAEETPLIDAVLRPGDALYLPRGFLHAAEALGGVSCHLTVGVHPVTRRAIAEQLFALVADDSALRGSLPLGIDVADPSRIADEVTAVAEALTSRLSAVSPSQVSALLAESLLGANRPEPLGPLAQLAAVKALSVESVVGVRPYLRHVLHVDDHVRLQLADRALTFDLAEHKALCVLLAGEPLRIKDFPDLDDESALGLARRLMREGVAVVHDEPGR